MRRTPLGGVRVAEALVELVVDQIDEVGRLACVDVLGSQPERSSFCLGTLALSFGGDVAGFGHGFEDEVTAFDARRSGWRKGLKLVGDAG